jgi:magnesium-protoporphyrin IX monomethyl ester (oxidative) cyclase
MRLLFVHPGPLLYTDVFLRLEPLGLELVAAAARRAGGHEIRLIDLQVESRAAYRRLVADWRPDLVAFSCNYLANIPEVIDLAKETKAALPRVFVTVGGHSASFTAREIVDHAGGAVDCVMKGEGETGIVALLEALQGDRDAVAQVPGAVTRDGDGPPPSFVHSLDDLRPARDLIRHRNKYFIGILDPAASIEFSRGCPWDCSFCSAWTFYGRSYRLVSPEAALVDISSVKEPGMFIVDDVAFVHAEHGFAIGEAIARKGIRKKYYLETRGDVLLRNKEVFRLWRKLGLEYIFLGLEAIDEEGLRKYRKRIPLGRNFEALEFARSLGVNVAINLIADPDWDRARFAALREWCLEVPEIVNISVNTPYPGTESWLTEDRRLTTRDYRLFDIQHAVMPTRLPLGEFYRELLETQRVLYAKHLNWRTVPDVVKLSLGLLMRGQTNFLRGMLKYSKIYNLERMLADHARDVRYAMPPRVMRPASAAEKPAKRAGLYIHAPKGRAARHIDDATEQFVDETRVGETP